MRIVSICTLIVFLASFPLVGQQTDSLESVQPFEGIHLEASVNVLTKGVTGSVNIAKYFSVGLFRWEGAAFQQTDWGTVSIFGEPVEYSIELDTPLEAIGLKIGVENFNALLATGTSQGSAVMNVYIKEDNPLVYRDRVYTDISLSAFNVSTQIYRNFFANLLAGKFWLSTGTIRVAQRMDMYDENRHKSHRGVNVIHPTFKEEVIEAIKYEHGAFHDTTQDIHDNLIQLLQLALQDDLV